MFFIYFFFSTVEDDFTSGVEAYKNNLYAAALRSMEAVLIEQDFPLRDSAYYIAALSAYKINDMEKAARYFYNFALLTGSQIKKKNAIEQSVISYLNLGKGDEGYKIFAAFPDIGLNPELLKSLGDTLYNQKQFEKAFKVYKQINEPEYALKAGKCLRNIAQYEKMQKFLKKSIDKYPKLYAKANTLIINTLFAINDTLSAFEEILSLNLTEQFDIRDIKSYIQTLLMFEEYETGLNFLKRIKGERNELLLLKAKAYRALDSILREEKILKRYIKKVGALPDEWASEYERIKAIKGKSFDRNKLLRITFYSPLEFEKTIKKLLEYDSETARLLLENLQFHSPFYKYFLAKAYDNLGEFKKARENYEAFIKLGIGSIYVEDANRRRKVLTLFYDKDPEKALDIFLKASSLEEKAYALFKYSKDYEKVLLLLDSVDTPMGLYLKGMSNYYLYLLKNNNRYIKLAKSIFEDLFWQYNDDSLAEDGLYMLFMTENKNIKNKITYGLDYLDHYPSGKFRNEILYKTAVLELAKGDTLDATGDFELLYLHSRKNPYTFPTLLMLARINLSEKDTSTCTEHLETIIKLSEKDSVYYEAMFMLADIEKARNNNISAFKHYTEILKGGMLFSKERMIKYLEAAIQLKRFNDINKLRNNTEVDIYKNLITLYLYIYKLRDSSLTRKDFMSCLKLNSLSIRPEYLFYTSQMAKFFNYDVITKHRLYILAFLKNEPLAYKAQRLLGEEYLKQRDDKKALRLYENLAEHYPKDKVILSRYIVALYRNGLLDKGDSVWERLDMASIEDKSPLLLEKIAFLMENKLSFKADTVLQFLSTVRKLKNDERFLYYRALVYFQQAKFKQAKEAYTHFIRLYKSSKLYPAAIFNLATTCYQLGEFDKALIYYERSKKYPNYKHDALFNMAFVYKIQQKWLDAIKTYKELLEISDGEERGEILFKIGFAYLQMKREIDALDYFKKALSILEKEQDRLECLYFMGEAYFGMGQYQNAINSYLKIVKDFPSNGDWVITAKFRAALAYELLGKKEEAKRIYKSILKQRGEEDPLGTKAKERLEQLNE